MRGQTSPSPVFPILVNEVSAGIGASCPTEARYSRPLIHMCGPGQGVGGAGTTLCMFFGGLVPGNSQGSRLVDAVGLPMELLSPISPKGVQNLSPMVCCVVSTSVSVSCW